MKAEPGENSDHMGIHSMPRFSHGIHGGMKAPRGTKWAPEMVHPVPSNAIEQGKRGTRIAVNQMANVHRCSYTNAKWSATAELSPP